MTHLWRILESLFLTEAKDAAYYRDQLIRRVQRKYSQHEADELVRHMQTLSPKEFQEYVEMLFVSPELNGLTKSMIDAERLRHPEKAGRGDLPTHSRSTDKGSGEASEPIPQRPDRTRSVDSPLHGPPRTSVIPGEKPSHAVGSAGQNAPRTQPTVAAGIIPQKHDPDRQPRSGVVSAQREVDRLYKDGDKDGALRLAKQLGVPSPEERFHYDRSGQLSRDPGGRPRIVVWGPDRVFKWQKADSQHLKLDPERGRAVSMQGVDAKEKSDSERRQQAHSRARDAAAGRIDPDRMDLIKRGILKRDKAGAAAQVGPKRPPSFDGEVWQPHGRSEEERTMRPDPITGNFTFGKRDTDPSKTGGKLIGLGDKWLTPSEYAATRASVAGVQLRKNDAPWRAWQHKPRRGVHAGPTPNSPSRRPPPRPVAPEDEDEFSDIPTDPGLGPDDGDEE